METEEPRCYTRRCVHFEGLKTIGPRPTSGKIVVICPAYPNGIPQRIAYGDDPHSEVQDDQKGTLTYEEAPV